MNKVLKNILLIIIEALKTITLTYFNLIIKSDLLLHKHDYVSMMTFTNTCVYILEKLGRRDRYTWVNLKEVSQTSFIRSKGIGASPGGKNKTSNKIERWANWENVQLGTDKRLISKSFYKSEWKATIIQKENREKVVFKWLICTG